MKKFWLFLVVLTVLCAASVFAVAEEQPYYKLGDKMEDFSIKLADGTEVSLYGLLAEKKVVLINFWATYCPPCKMEFPHMKAAYDAMSDEVGVIAISAYPIDTDEALIEYQKQVGLETLPMAIDTIGLSKRFEQAGIPYSAIIDRNGIVCMEHNQAIFDTDAFLRIFRIYTAEDYSEPVLLTDVPPLEMNAVVPDDATVIAALGLDNDTVKPLKEEEADIWPFIPLEDGNGLTAPNGQILDSTAKLNLSVRVEEGQALGFQYSVSTKQTVDGLLVYVDGGPVFGVAGQKVWQDRYITFDKAGEHTVTFLLTHDAFGTQEDISASLRNVRVISADEIAAIDAAETNWPRTLEGNQCSLEVVEGDTKTVNTFANDEPSYSLQLVNGDVFKIRIRVGSDVDVKNVQVVVNTALCYMLDELEYDDEGFFFSPSLAPDTIMYTPFSTVKIYDTLVPNDDKPLAAMLYVTSEASMESYIKYYAQAFNIPQEQMRWEYADGSAKQTVTTETTATAEPVAPESPKLEVLVTDEAGTPVEGVMVQICDDSTCMVLTTDAQGLVKIDGKVYPYEVHILSVPDSFESTTEVQTMPAEGGTLEFHLKHQ